jgi:hypothetical protein
MTRGSLSRAASRARVDFLRRSSWPFTRATTRAFRVCTCSNLTVRYDRRASRQRRPGPLRRGPPPVDRRILAPSPGHKRAPHAARENGPNATREHGLKFEPLPRVRGRAIDGVRVRYYKSRPIVMVRELTAHPFRGRPRATTTHGGENGEQQHDQLGRVVGGQTALAVLVVADRKALANGHRFNCARVHLK